MQFSTYLEEKDADLLERAKVYGINVDTLNSLFQQNETIALRALHDLIKSVAPNFEKSKVDHVQIFIAANQKDIDTLTKTYNKIIVRIEEYKKKHNVKLLVDFTSDPIIRLGRAKRGTRIRHKRDLGLIYQYMKEKGLSYRMRTRASEIDPYEYAEILPDGRIKSAYGVHDHLHEWTFEVKKGGIARGTRQHIVGSPWRAVDMMDDNEDWRTMDYFYGKAMEEED